MLSHPTQAASSKLPTPLFWPLPKLLSERLRESCPLPHHQGHFWSCSSHCWHHCHCRQSVATLCGRWVETAVVGAGWCFFPPLCREQCGWMVKTLDPGARDFGFGFWLMQPPPPPPPIPSPLCHPTPSVLSLWCLTTKYSYQAVATSSLCFTQRLEQFIQSKIVSANKPAPLSFAI